MARLVHITNIENERRIKRSGIKSGQNNIVFFMPHMKDFLISHQWARELKRSGIKNFAAVDFKISNNEEIWFGKYNSQHEKMPLNKAISLFMNKEDPLGYEFFIERSIKAKEILKIRKIPKPVGWRYTPKAHGKPPCPCSVCIQAGGYKTKNLKDVIPKLMSRDKAKKIITTSVDGNEIWEAVERLQGKWKKESPKFLERLLNNYDDEFLLDIVKLLSEYRHPLAKEYLHRLTYSSCEDVKELAFYYLQKM